MRTNEAIAILQALRDAHGDAELTVYDQTLDRDTQIDSIEQADTGVIVFVGGEG